MFGHDPSTAVVVAVDVGKDTLAVSVTDGRRRVLLAPFDAAMTRPGLAVRWNGSGPSWRPGPW